MTEKNKLIKDLNLRYLTSGESGYLNEIATSSLKVRNRCHSYKANSSIYYMLTREYPINYLHWLAMDDTHILCKGGPLSYYVFNKDGTSEEHVLGNNLTSGEELCIMVPAGSWKALKLHKGVEYALMVSILTPEWTKDRVKIGAGQEFIDKYAHSSPWATPDFLKELIGPNFRM